MTWKVDDSLIDLGGFTARLQVRPSVSSDKIIMELDDTDGITLGGTAGRTQLTRTAEQSAALAPGKYVHDLELVSGTGVITRLVQGQLDVDPEGTRPGDEDPPRLIDPHFLNLRIIEEPLQWAETRDRILHILHEPANIDRLVNRLTGDLADHLLHEFTHRLRIPHRIQVRRAQHIAHPLLDDHRQ